MTDCDKCSLALALNNTLLNLLQNDNQKEFESIDYLRQTMHQLTLLVLSVTDLFLEFLRNMEIVECERSKHQILCFFMLSTNIMFQVNRRLN